MYTHMHTHTFRCTFKTAKDCLDAFDSSPTLLVRESVKQDPSRLSRVPAVRLMLRERQRSLHVAYKSREEKQMLKLSRIHEAEVRSLQRTLAGYRLTATNTKRKQVLSENRLVQAREHIRQQRKKHEDQVDEWLKEIDDLKQRLDMALAGVSQTVDPSSWKMQIKTLHQSIRR